MSRHDKDSVTGVVRGKLERLDSYQRRHPALGVPIAVVRKFIEDESTSRAAQIAFWVFFSVSVASHLRHPARLFPAI
jgi:hypothetical protein